MEKKPFLTEAMAQEIIQDVPTPFHVYDEKGIRENARRINKAFSWNKGFKEYFAVKALPNPVILQILQEEGCGVDCSSLTELMLSEVCGFTGSDIMFSSNQTPVEDMQKAYELGAYINLDDATMVDFLDRVAGVPETVFCRYNPGGTFSLGESEEGFQVMDKPGEMGRFTTGPYGALVATAIHEKHIYKEYIGLDACAANLMRPAMYGAYHHITVLGKEDAPCDHMYDVVGGLCENNDKFAIDRMLPKIDIGDVLYIHDTGAHGSAMGYNYNGKLRSAEVLLCEDGSHRLIRRAETPRDYFATLDFLPLMKPLFED